MSSKPSQRSLYGYRSLPILYDSEGENFDQEANYDSIERSKREEMDMANQNNIQNPPIFKRQVDMRKPLIFKRQVQLREPLIFKRQIRIRKPLFFKRSIDGIHSRNPSPNEYYHED